MTDGIRTDQAAASNCPGQGAPAEEQKRIAAPVAFEVVPPEPAEGGPTGEEFSGVQQATGPLLLVAMGGYFMAVTAVNVPSAEWVALASLVPFFSPYLMPIRMLLGSPPSAPELLLALGLLAIAIVVAIWLAARIYSAGVLLYGQRVRVRSGLRATRVSR